MPVYNYPRNVFYLYVQYHMIYILSNIIILIYVFFYIYKISTMYSTWGSDPKFAPELFYISITAITSPTPIQNVYPRLLTFAEIYHIRFIPAQRIRNLTMFKPIRYPLIVSQ